MKPSDGKCTQMVRNPDTDTLVQPKEPGEQLKRTQSTVMETRVGAQEFLHSTCNSKDPMQLDSMKHVPNKSTPMKSTLGADVASTSSEQAAVGSADTKQPSHHQQVQLQTSTLSRFSSLFDNSRSVCSSRLGIAVV